MIKPKEYIGRLLAYWKRYGAYVLLPLLTVGLASFSEVHHAQLRCQHMDIAIVDADELGFILSLEIKDRLATSISGVPQGVKVDSLDTEALEVKLGQGAFVKESSLYHSLKGILHVRISQRKPIVRLAKQNLKDGFYLDTEGRKMPLSSYYTARVPLAYGQLSEPLYPLDTLKTANVLQVYALARFIDSNSLYRSFTGQLRVEPNGDMVMLPKLARHTVVVGSATNLEEKFEKLTAFYRKVLPVKGWDHYDTINLKYKNQVVAK